MTTQTSAAPCVRSLIVMGVSGCGKTSVGATLANKWGFAFVDGDELHSAANIDKMRSLVALTDEDRWPWLDRISVFMNSALLVDAGIVVACSALRRMYRNRLRLAANGAIRFIYLDVSRTAIERRMASRSGHFMPPSLIGTQFSTLEPPGLDERDVITVKADGPLDQIVEVIISAFH